MASVQVEELVGVLGWRDAVDLVTLTFIVYTLLKLIRGTRAVQVLLGILVLTGIWYGAQLLDLRGLQVLLGGLIVFLPFAIIVLFQQPIRRALANFGKNPLFGLPHQERSQSGFQEIVLAAGALSAKRIGALVVIERGEGLRDYVENGIVLDAVVSFDLLLTIFNPGGPLHDGAAIVQGDRVAAAACFLPLSTNPELSTSAGTRHRAALGITEETDAMAVVVSEETGKISLALGGELMAELDARSLRNHLYRHLISDERANGGGVP